MRLPVFSRNKPGGAAGGMGSRQFYLQNIGDTVAEQHGFPAHSVIIHTYTNGFLRIPNVGDIPPLIYGTVVPLDGSQVAIASLVAPPLLPGAKPPPVPIAVASLQYFDEHLPPNPGNPLS